MSQRIVCDHCKDPRREAMRAFIPTGKWSPDPAGGSSTQDMDVSDFCLACAIKRLERETTP